MYMCIFVYIYRCSLVFELYLSSFIGKQLCDLYSMHTLTFCWRTLFSMFIYHIDTVMNA